MKARAEYGLLLAALLTGLALPGPAVLAETLIAKNASGWRYHKGTTEASSPRDAWRSVEFDDSAWSSGQASFGYGETHITTTAPFADMQGNYTTIFLRKTFTVADAASVTDLMLEVDYDDGFIVWVNGDKVLSEKAPSTPLCNSTSSSSHESGTYEVFLDGIPDPDDYLVTGENVLAVMVFNGGADSSDCKIDVSLSSVKLVADTKFSQDRGYYDAPFTVTIRTATAGATIRYTTDGSVPTASHGSSGVTPVPVPISTTRCLRAAAFKADHIATDVDTQTYIFAEHVKNQTDQSPSGDYVNWDTEMDPQVVNASAYKDMIVGALKSIPTMSIVVEHEDMFGSEGIHRGDNLKLVDYEVPCSVEMFYPDDYPRSHDGGFQINCGIRIQGGGGRWDYGIYDPKQSFGLRFRSIYGNSRLNYPVFEDAPVGADSAADEFDKLVLRAGHNKGWAGGIYPDRDGSATDNNPKMTTFARDEFGRATQIAMSGIGGHGVFVHLYINGLYWGLYNPCERQDHAFSATYLGGSEEDWYAVKTRGGTVSGNATRFDYWRNTVSSSSDFNLLKEYCHVESYSDLALLNVYLSTGDMPQYYMGNRNNPPGPAYGYAWDMEDILYDFYRSSRDPSISRFGKVWEFYDMWTHNKDFRMCVADRAYRACRNGGALTDAAMTERWLALCDYIEDAVVGESARWGDQREADPFYSPWRADLPYTRDGHWYAARDYVTAGIQGNASILLNDMRVGSYGGYNYYPLIDPPAFKHGGAIGAGFKLTMSNPNSSGTIYYTLDGTDPRALGGTKSGTHVQYGAPVSLTRTRHVRARVYKSTSTWSALHEATFNYTAHYPALRITEIHYKPVGGSGFEFIELRNTSGSTTRGLSQMRFAKGIDYTFPPGAELAAGKFAVLVRDEALFTSRYPGVKGSSAVQIFGVYRGKLDNGGERLSLVDSDGAPVTSVRYNDKEPWPEAPDDEGYSLVFAGTGDQDDPAKWRTSNLIGGSPGYDEGPEYRVLINEALTHTDLPQVDTVELYNAGEVIADIGGWWLSDSNDDYRKYQIPAGTTLAAGGYRLYDETHFGFQLDSHGDQVYLTKWDSNDNLQYYAEARFGGAENGRAFGRHVTSDGDTDFVAQSVGDTLGSANAEPLVGPIVISELMYHPPDGGDEFVELMNVSDGTVRLYDPANPANTWRLDGAVEYAFPSGTELAPGETIVVIAGDSRTEFRDKYAVPADVQIFKQYTGALDNGGESVKLWRPGEPDAKGIPWILVDRVKYNDNSPWPESPDGDGPSLERIAPTLYGNDPANWSASLAAAGTPGEANSGVLVAKTAGWRYSDTGANLGTGWRGTGYDDSRWPHGNAPLGYPDTNPAIDTETDYGPDPSGKYTTTYFRTSFMLDADPAEIDSLTLRVRYDDGYVAYLNGVEVARGGMPTGTITHHTLANTSNGSGGLYEQKNVNSHADKLVTGLNVLAVELHQIGGGSSDTFMDLELLHTVVQIPTVARPQIAPNGGEFSGSVSVTVSTTTAGATVFCTTDGVTPSAGSHDHAGVGSVQFSLSSSATVKAMAAKQDMADSSVAQAQFTDTSPLADDVPFAAYNDLCWVSGEPTANVTRLTMAESGALVDYATGRDTPVTLTVSGGSGPYTTQGVAPAAGTDADQVFGGKVGLAGLIGYNVQDLELAFSGLNTGMRYELVLFGNRGVSAYSGRTSIVTLSSVAPGFRNQSTAGTAVSTTSLTDDTTTVGTGYNTVNGHVARYVGIDPGSDGVIRLTVSDSTSKYYANAVMLKAVVPTATATLLERGAAWKYDDTGTDLGTGWRNAGYNDGGWSSGDAGLGFPATKDGVVTVVSYGSNANDKHPTTYFRKHFALNADPADVAAVSMEVCYDDGFVAYLNGTEVARRCMPAGTIVYGTLASTGNGSQGAYEQIDLTAHSDRLVQGENVLAVEMHQVSATSSDLILDLGLTAEVPDGGSTETTEPIGIGSAWNYRKGTTEASSPATAWRAVFFDDSGWSSGDAPFGYGPLSYGTTLNMGGNYASVFLRKSFSVENPGAVNRVSVSVDYDDGFILWLNGEELVRVNVDGAPGTFVGHDQTCSGYVSGSSESWAGSFEKGTLPELREQNVLAVQLFNNSLHSGDAMLDVALSVERETLSAAEDGDQDALPDAWETDQFASAGTWDWDDDPDQDGQSNMDEFVCGTGANDQGSYLAVDVGMVGGQLVVSFPTLTAAGPGYDGLTRRYALQARGTLGAGAVWSAVPGYESIEGQGQTVSYSNVAAGGSVCYRARVWLED